MPLRACLPLRARRGQRGAAVLLALFIATLATLIVTGLFYRQFVLLRTIENEQLAAQSRLLLRGALDWSRAILRTDADNSSFDSLTESWAQPLADMRLDALGETAALAARASISGSIEDAQGRYNLRNLVNAAGQPVEREIEALRRLVVLLDLPPAVADLVAARMLESAPPTSAEATSKTRPLPPLFPGDLAGIAGIDAEAAYRLAPYLIVLDERTPLNINTAPAELIAARIAGLSLAEARAVVAQRERLGHFRNVDDFRNYLRGNVQLLEGDVASSSRFFLVRGQVRLDRAVTRMEALLKRGPNNIARVLWQRELL